MISRFRQFFQQLYARWLGHRLPPARQVQLNTRSLFIFPSKAGFSFVLLVVLCWLVATNYENNLVFGITCLLTAIFVVAILHSFANLSGLNISCSRVSSGHAGHPLTIELVLHQSGKRLRENLIFAFDGHEPVAIDIAATEEARVKLGFVPASRGLIDPGRLCVESLYPLGLFRVWTQIDLNIRCLVYPSPQTALNRRTTASPMDGGEGLIVQILEGGEDFTGLSDYRPGDSPKRIAWKQFAREQGLYTKHYGSAQDERLWLDWDAFPGLDTEARLSRLCGLLLSIVPLDIPYGLKLPGLTIAPNTTDSHRLQVLRELALFGLPDRGGEW